MNTTTLSVDRGALLWWALWIVLSVIGFSLGIFAGLQSAWTLVESLELMLGQVGTLTITGAILGASIGLGLGLGQWVQMRAFIGAAWRWPLMSAGCGLVAGAMGIAALVAVSGGAEDPHPLFMLAAFALVGAGIGLGQWLLLHNVADHPGRVIIGAALGIGFGVITTFSLGGEGREWVAFLFGGLVAAVATGLGISSSAIHSNVQ